MVSRTLRSTYKEYWHWIWMAIQEFLLFNLFFKWSSKTSSFQKRNNKNDIFIMRNRQVNRYFTHSDRDRRLTAHPGLGRWPVYVLPRYGCASSSAISHGKNVILLTGGLVLLLQIKNSFFLVKYSAIQLLHLDQLRTVLLCNEELFMVTIFISTFCLGPFVGLFLQSWTIVI